MVYIDWLIEGPTIASCNGATGCACEVNARPTNEICEGREAQRIDRGSFGDVQLDRRIMAARYRSPGPVHEGKGVAQGVIDDRASPEQRAARLQILGGKEPAPTTVCNLYGVTIEQAYAPRFAPIAFSCELAKRTGDCKIPGVMAMRLETIRNPVTGAEHHARSRLAKGFAFRAAGVASRRFTASGEIVLTSKNVYGLLTHVAYGPHGIIERPAA